MESPKFPHKRRDLEQVISVSALKFFWKKKVRNFLRHQPVPDPLEHLDLQIALTQNCEAIFASVCSGTYIPHPPMRLLSEKANGLCRQLVIPRARDALLLQTLSDALWREVKHKAPSSNAFYAPNDQRFSHWHGGHSSEYGPIAAWLNFQKAILSFSKRRRFIVVTDIANYYDFISYDHLRNILADLAVVREHALDFLIYMLSHMLWQPDYMPKVHVGLPQINIDGARLLAHCFLFEVDRLFVNQPKFDYARYMDDMNIGVDSLIEAKAALRDLDLALQTRQIRLNSGKTKILDEKEAQRHFRVFANARLDQLQISIESALKAKKPILSHKHLLSRAICKGIKNQKFNSGNGEKILKRCINFSKKYESEIDNESFKYVLTERPALREALLLYWQKSASPIDKLPIIRDFIVSGHVVDDLAPIGIAVALVSTRLPSSLKTDFLIQELSHSLNMKRKWSLYACFWIASKYGTPEYLMDLIERTTSVWVVDDYLSRVVGGLYPRFIGHVLMTKFRNIIRRESASAQAVVDFHHALEMVPKQYSFVKKFISARHPSYPNLITHSKFLMLVSLLKGGANGPKIGDELRFIHAHALSDPFYCLMF